VEFHGGRRLGRDLTVEGLRRDGFEAVLLALGAQRGARPEIPGADLSGVDDALAFLERPPPCAGESVLVLGGGDVAVDVARTARRNGTASVTLAFPEPEEEMAAARDTVLLAVAEGAKLLPGHAAAALEPGGGGRVASATLSAVRDFRREAGSSISFELAGPSRPLAVTRVVFATGQRSDLAGVELPPGVAREDGWLAADVHGRTGAPWLFAAGDVVTGPANVTAAMAAGVRAAWAIDVYLSAGRREVTPCAAPLPRPAPPAVHHATRAEVALTPEQARAEAQRCLLCGLCKNCNTCTELLACPAIARPDGEPEIVAELCVSCGACVQTCPNHAIGVPPAGLV